ncbi:unnamed protein product [Allacma fusca]|uniref:Endoplasmic reticulum lectin 1 n=1 Tax=Allacma fusca TaxID=39272 RepID=A0A8J2L8A8_9HEXA|nr:unnamed protein product [Allacma fusca]
MAVVIRKICWVLVGVIVAFASATYFDALDDSILHKINWLDAGSDDSLLNEPLDSIMMSTARNERYRCTLPRRQDNTADENGVYNGPNPIEILAPLFNKFVCTFKLETYWTYELCHGKYIRQYHEEREGKKVKLQEYHLGKWDDEALDKMKAQVAQEVKDPDYKSKIPTKKIDGVNMPYLQINMSDGTVCDLNGQTRMTRVLYVCYPHGKHEINSLEETSTCEYEIVVLSPLLCQHPDYMSKETGENMINCYTVDDAPKTPKAMAELEAETYKIRHEQLLQNLETLLETQIKGDAKPVELIGGEEDTNIFKQSTGTKPVLHDASFLNGFLEGKHCLTGGSHWWKFEFCYEKYVLQYHEEPGSSSRTEIILGKWDVEKHKEWLAKNPSKKSSSLESKKTVHHFYSGGASCDQTGTPRTVEVRLKCTEHNSQSPSAVALYLLEPKTCEYILGVESNLFCPILKTVDDHGLFDHHRRKGSSMGMPTSSSIPSDSRRSRDRSPTPKVKKLKTAEDVESSIKRFKFHRFY